MRKKQTTDILTEMLDLDGKRVVDVGCGDGVLTRLMTRHGARVIGIDTNPAQLDKARRAEPAGGETYGQAAAEDLPMEDNSQDIVVLSNSLHHVDVDKQPEALKEAARVLKDRGLAYICEPLAEGSNFEMMQPVHDETAVRRAAYETIKGAADWGLEEITEMTFCHTSRHESFEALRDQVCTVNPHTKPKFEAKETEMRAAFETLGVKGDKGWEFDQPMRVNLLRKSS